MRIKTIELTEKNGTKWYLYHGNPLSSNTLYQKPDQIPYFKHSTQDSYLKGEKRAVCIRAGFESEQVKIVTIETDENGLFVKVIDDTYLLGCCTNIDCTEFGGGWKYPHDYPENDQKDCFCPGCGGPLEFIEQSDES